jgi:hypothetical protein
MVMVVKVVADYTLEQAEEEIAQLRGMVNLLLEAHTKTESTDIPNAPSTGHISFSQNGVSKFIGTDGNVYSNGRNRQLVAAATINSTSNQSLASWVVNAGTYGFEAAFGAVNGGTNATQAFRLTGPSASDVMLIYAWLSNSSFANCQVGWQTALNADMASAAAWTAGDAVIVYLHGTVVFSANGTCNFNARCVTSGADTWAIRDSSYVDLIPLS